MAGVAAGVSTAAEWVDFTAAEWADSTAAVSTGVDLADFTVISRVCTMVSASGMRVFAIGVGFSSVA